MTDSDTTFEQEIAAAINRRSRENRSNTPDFILARVMVAALEAFEAGVTQRERWGSAARVEQEDSSPDKPRGE